MKERKPTLQDLVRIPKHPNYYVNPVNKKITYRRTVKGERIKIPTGKTKITEAIDFVETELKRRATGESVARIRREKKGVVNPTITDLWNECLEERKDNEPGTLITYRTSWKYALEPFFGNLTLSHITETDSRTGQRRLRKAKLIEFKVWYLATYPKRQFLQKHLVMLFNYLHRRGYIGAKPDVDQMEIIKSINATIRKKNKVEDPGRVATEDEQRALLDAAEAIGKFRIHGVSEDELPHVARRTKLLILLGLRYGLRKMEAGKLLRERIDLKRMIFQAWSFKNHEWRELPLMPEVAEAYRDHLKVSPESQWVFPMATDPSRHMSGQLLDKGWIAAKEIAKIEGRLRFHDLRHSFASRTADEGWPPILACEILDMSLDVYQNVYAKGSLKRKEQLLRATFAQSFETDGRSK